MTDRFKFRVWDKLDEEYYDENCFQMQIESSGDLFIIGVGNDGEDCFWETDNTVIEQCTGLKDKNGKLIYENDLIKIDSDVAVIKWSDYYARFMLESQEDNFDFETTYAEECEVIGNIHENADLLESENG